MKGQQKEIEELKLAINGNGNLTQNGQEINNSQSVNSLIETIKQLLNNLGLAVENGIARVKELWAEKITAKKLCIEGDDGETICVDKNQLKDLLQKNGIESTASAPSESPLLAPDSTSTPSVE